jgi:hypothetical protein
VKFIKTFTGLILAITAIVGFFKSCEDEPPPPIKAEITVNINESIEQPLKVEIETPEQIKEPVAKKHHSTTKKVEIPMGTEVKSTIIEPDYTDKINFIYILKIATPTIWGIFILYFLLILYKDKESFLNILMLLVILIGYYILFYKGTSLIFSSDVITAHDDQIFMWLAGLNISIIVILLIIISFSFLLNLQNSDKSLHNFFRICFVLLEIPAILLFIISMIYII